MNDCLQDSKRRDLHAEWDTAVFGKIQDRIQRQVDSRSAESVEKRLMGQVRET